MKAYIGHGILFCAEEGINLEATAPNTNYSSVIYQKHI